MVCGFLFPQILKLWRITTPLTRKGTSSEQRTQRSNIVWILVVPPGMPALKYTKSGNRKEVRVFLHKGANWTSIKWTDFKIYFFFWLDSCHPDIQEESWKNWSSQTSSNLTLQIKILCEPMMCCANIGVVVYIDAFICIIAALGNKFQCSQCLQKYKLGYNMVMVEFSILNTKLFSNFLHKIGLVSKFYGCAGYCCDYTDHADILHPPCSYCSNTDISCSSLCMDIGRCEGN